MADDPRTRWVMGYGPIRHTALTQRRVETLAHALATSGVRGDGLPVYEVLVAADRIASAAMWLVVHETYARNVLLEPGRFRAPRSERERRHLTSGDIVARLYPSTVGARVFVTHTRAEPLVGTLGPLHTGPGTIALGFMNQGGTLSVDGMLFVNGQTWAHCVDAVASLVGLDREDVLSEEEISAIDRRRSPHGIIINEPQS